MVGQVRVGWLKTFWISAMLSDSNYTGFRLRPNGRLDPIAGSTASLAANAAPGDVLFNGTGPKLAGTEVGPR
jgi:hypothetical protein